jgi:peptidoglycan hydrolase-like protein with peptidoglycan-binding domain
MMKVEVDFMRRQRIAAVIVTMSLVGCAGNPTSAPTDSTPPATTTHEPSAPPGSPTTSTVPITTTTTVSPSADHALLRPDGLGPVDFGTPVDEALAMLTAKLGEPDRDSTLGPGGECVEGADWLDCVRDLRVIEQGRLVTWDDRGLQIVFVDSAGTAPQQSLVPLQFGDWLTTPAIGEPALTTAEGLYPGMSMGELQNVEPDLEFGYGEGVLTAFFVGSAEVGGYWGTLDWDPATAGNDISEMVRAVQAALNATGADLAVDGEWGPRSQAAWADFLSLHGIEAFTTQLWLTSQIGDALGLPPDDSTVASLGPRPPLGPDGRSPSALALRVDGFGTYDFGDPAEELVSELVYAFGPPNDQVVFSAQPPDRLYMPGGYPALYDLVQYEWSDPSFLIILSDTPFLGDHWGEPVPGTLHLISWESTSGQLPLDNGLVVGSTLAQLRAIFPELTIGHYDICETDFAPDDFFAAASTYPLRGRLNWDWTTNLQLALNERGAALDADGIYGPATRAAVEQFQQANDLDDPDGLIGPETVDALGINAPSDAEVVRLRAGYQGSC